MVAIQARAWMGPGLERSVIGLGEDVRYTDESKVILKSMLNEDVLTDSDGGVK